MKGREYVVVAMLCWSAGMGLVRADVIELAPERHLEGVVVQETADRVRVQVSWQGYVTLDRAGIVSIVRASTEENARLQASWQQEASALRARERAQQAFEQQQRERGYVKYQGEWITREELAVVQEDQLNKEREARAEQDRQIAAQLQALREENARLQQEVAAAQQRFLATPATVIIRECAPFCSFPHRVTHHLVTAADGRP